MAKRPKRPRDLHGLKCTRIQCDEVWAFVYAKAKNEEIACSRSDKTEAAVNAAPRGAIERET